jgi:hypothetical protein
MATRMVEGVEDCGDSRRGPWPSCAATRAARTSRGAKSVASSMIYDISLKSLPDTIF